MMIDDEKRQNVITKRNEQRYQAQPCVKTNNKQ